MRQSTDGKNIYTVYPRACATNHTNLEDVRLTLIEHGELCNDGGSGDVETQTLV